MNEPPSLDYRFSLANERTFLAWIRTALALVIGGVAAAKALNFESEVWRWAVSAPPVVGGAALAALAGTRLRRYDAAMRAGTPLPVGRGLHVVAVAVCVYAVFALVVTAIDG